VLLGWTGQTVALIAILATMALLSTERDRGTLGWTLTNPVSPTSVISAKFVVAFVVFVATAVLLPMLISIGLATVLYGLPDLALGRSSSFMALPAFTSLTIALGAGIVDGRRGRRRVRGCSCRRLSAAAADRERALADVDRIWTVQVARGQPASILTPSAGRSRWSSWSSERRWVQPPEL
jgi:hypothetical protein